MKDRPKTIDVIVPLAQRARGTRDTIRLRLVRKWDDGCARYKSGTIELFVSSRNKWSAAAGKAFDSPDEAILSVFEAKQKNIRRDARYLEKLFRRKVTL